MDRKKYTFRQRRITQLQKSDIIKLAISWIELENDHPDSTVKVMVMDSEIILYVFTYIWKLAIK